MDSGDRDKRTGGWLNPLLERRTILYAVFEVTRGRGFAANARAANEWMQDCRKDGCLESFLHNGSEEPVL